MTEFKTGDYAMVRVGAVQDDTPHLVWLTAENGRLAGSVASTALSPLPPPATEAERRLVEAAIAHTRRGAKSYYTQLVAAADAVLAERKPPDPPDPVDPGAEVLAAWEEWTEEGVDPSRLNLAMLALAASRSDGT